MADRKYFIIYVGSAGIGRLGFGTWVGNQLVDRSDGDDSGTFESLREALADAGKRVQEILLACAWSGREVPFGKVAKGRLASDIHPIHLTYDGHDFIATWTEEEYRELVEDQRNVAMGKTPVEALTMLGEQTEAHLAHSRWVLDMQPDR